MSSRRAPPTTPMRLSHSPMLDKENATNRYGKDTKRFETTKPSVLLQKTTTPRRKQPFHSTGATPPATTPPGSSKVLRTHFAQLSVTPQRTKIQSGAVRLQPSSSSKPSCRRPKRTTKGLSSSTTPQKSPAATRRIGYDGTSQTPSKELLRSTACTRGHQVTLHHDDDDDANVVDTRTIPLRQEGQPVIGRRDDCCDPVALILLNDAGGEDLATLLEQDVSPAKSSGGGIQKVSSSLTDVMDHDEVATLVRPKPRVVRFMP